MRLLFILLAFVMLTGCASKQIELSVRPVSKPDLVLPEADVLSLKKVEWILITEANSKEAFNAVKDQGRPVVLFGLTDEGYENLSLNFSDIRAYMQQQQKVLEAYKNYYHESAKAIDKANGELDRANKTVDEANKANAPWWQSVKDKFLKSEDSK